MRAKLHRARGRALTVVVCVVGLLAVFALGVFVGRRTVKVARAQDVMREIEVARQRAIDAAAVAPGTPAPVSGANRLKEFKSALGEAAARLGKDERKPLLAAQELVARIQPQMAEYENSLKALAEARYVAPASIKTQDELKARRALVKRFSESNEALVKYFQNAERDYRAALDKLGVAENVKQGVMEGFQRGGNFDLNLKIHETNRQLATSMQGLLKLLDREWGAWRTNERGAAIFDREDAVKEFETLQGELTAAAARHEAAEKELMDRAAKSQKP